MQIQLKQAEIVTALKQYIASQGINLVGKDVSISFTAGRKEAGIIADLVIEDVTIPGFTDEGAIELKPVALTVVPAVAPQAPVEAPAAEPVAQEPAAPDASQEAAPAVKTTSLFN